MAEFKAGTREQVKNGQAQYVAGDIVSKDAINAVGGGTVRTKAVTQVTGRSGTGRITNAQTVLYVEKNGTFQPAAIKKDGKWSYSDPEYPLMAGVADAELQKDLADSDSLLNRTTNNGIKAELGKRQDVLPADVDTVLGAKQNVETDPPPSGLDGRPLNTETVPIEDLPKSQGGGKPDNSAAKNTRSKFGNLKFPLTIGSTNMDVIKFSMLEFSPRKVVKKGSASALGGRGEDRNAIGTVVLPIPGAITDQNVADWGDGRINPLQLAGLEIAGQALSQGGGFSAAGGEVERQLKQLSGTASQAKDALKGVISAAAVGISADEVLARTQGAVVNPNLELLFKGPTLRPFNFTFQMGARNDKESDEIMRILRFFKQGGSPQRTAAQYLVKAPHTFQIEYLHRGEKGEQNKYLNKIKECALLSVGVNYTPNNNYATFKNGAPVSIELSLSFKELEPVYNDEYGQGDGDVGF